MGAVLISLTERQNPNLLEEAVPEGWDGGVVVGGRLEREGMYVYI